MGQDYADDGCAGRKEGRSDANSENPTIRAFYGSTHVEKSATRRNTGADHYPVRVGNDVKTGLQQIEQ